MTPKIKRKAKQPAKGSPPVATVRHDITLLSDDDLYMFNEGTHYRLYDKLGAHVRTVDGVLGTHFAVWAPNASKAYVMGNFNEWDKSSHPLHIRGKSGIWEGFIAGVDTGEVYKYYIASRYHNYCVEKTDPFAFFSETPPKTASIVSTLDYKWEDGTWMENRWQRNAVRRFSCSVVFIILCLRLIR